jgi:O-antigen ligase
VSKKLLAGIVVVVLATAAITAFALVEIGLKAAVLPVAAVFLMVLLTRPAVLLGIFLTATVLCEIDPSGFLGFRTFYYNGKPSTSDVLFVAVVVSVAFDLARRRRAPRLPQPLTLPLALIALALVAGLATGYVSGGDRLAMFNGIRSIGVLVLLPFVVVNVLEKRADVWRFAIGAAVLSIEKGIEGIVSWSLGAGRQLGSTTLTFYAPAPNFLLLTFLLVVLGALATRVRLPIWVYLGAPICLAAFVLSFRRNFWIAGVVGLLLLLLVGSGFRGRRILVVALAASVIAVRLALSVTAVPDLQTSVVERVTSLTPSRVEAQRYDRYRLDEARNVFAAIRSQPFTGLGLGVPWEAKYPLPVELDGGREYTHVVVLWWWLKLGILGLFAYVATMGVAIATALAVARGHPEARIRAVSLGVFAGLIGLVVAETTGSFTGVSRPLSILVAAMLGWLAAARRELAPVTEEQPEILEALPARA